MSTVAVLDRARRRRTFICVLVVVLLCVGIASESVSLRRDMAFNLALDEARAQSAAGHASVYGQFASAYTLQRDGDLDTALSAYGRLSEAEPIETGADTRLGERLRFNLSTLYLQKAASMSNEPSNQARLPLVELAKQGFRDVLRANPAHWPSRYNLTRAIELVPDLLEVTQEEDRMPERSPRAPQDARAHDRLP
ncbi:MAG: hypothetical protein ACR2RL_19895 [Gammaproteobacteria bacterium]